MLSPALPHRSWLARRTRWLLLVLLPVVCLQTPVLTEFDEQQVKAAFLLNFVKFVSWPDAAAPAGAPIVIAIIGADDLGRALEREASGQLVAGRTVSVQTLHTLPEAGPLPHLLFIGASQRDTLSALLRKLEGRPVLTVGDAAGFGASGVVLNFYVSDKRIRFEANTTAAARAGLHISSHLLRIARIVG